MSRLRRFGLLGLVVVALAALSIGTRLPLQAQPPAPVAAAAFVGGAFGGNSTEGAEVHRQPQSPAMTVAEMKVRMKLQEKIPLNFPNETPLFDLVKSIRENTTDKADFPDGLPIYLDPIGLQDADQTSHSTFTIDLKGIPLATTLKLALDQLNLAYWVNPDGLIIVTSKASEDLPDPTEKAVVERLAEVQKELRSLRSEILLLRGLPAGGGMGSVGGPAGGMGGGLR